MIGNALRIALRAIRRNLFRSFLTILGIVIGVAAVITMVTLGHGATQAVAAQVASLGSNLIIVRPGQRLGPGRDSSAAPNFKVADAAAIATQISGVEAVAPTVGQGVTVVAQGRNWSTAVTGSTGAIFQVGNWQLAEGRVFSEAEERAGMAVAVLGETVRQELFGHQSAIGSTLRIKQFSATVIGVLKAKGQTAMGSDQDDTIILPLRTVQRRLTGNLEVSGLRISVADGVATEPVMRRLALLLRDRRKLAANEEDNFSILDTKQIAQALSSTTQVMTGLLGAVAAVSLVVGGIGIMNIMLVSVTERTREIGIRLAIGALEGEVLAQFLIEAVALSSLGGILGVTLATAASVALAGVMQVPYRFDPTINLLAVAFAAVIGVIFGYFPARRAARLDPIEALRYE